VADYNWSSVLHIIGTKKAEKVWRFTSARQFDANNKILLVRKNVLFQILAISFIYSLIVMGQSSPVDLS
jgi:hypothetical protein